MSRKLAPLLMVILVGMSGLFFEVQRVEASGTIYIRADGSIDPTDASISTFDNVTYTFVSNISGSVVVERDSIVVDGAGYTVRGTGDIESKGIDLSSRINVTVMNTEITTWGYGIYLDYSSNNNISGNTIKANNFPGICLQHDCSNNSISGNNIANTGSGVALGLSCNYNSVSGNNITNSTTGIGLGSSSNYNSISGNNITGISETIRNYNYNYGIELWGSLNNSIVGNNITANKWSGIRIGYSSNNRIYRNNFVDNTKQVYIDMSGYANFWDDNYPSGGNYWSDYNGTDANHDGIGDAPYIIDANNTDNYPLMVQYVILEFPSFLILPLFFIATLLAVIVYKRKCN